MTKIQNKILSHPILRNRSEKWAIDVESGEFLYGLIRMIKPKCVIETGTFEGFSAVYIAQGLKDNGFGFLWTIDHKDYDAKKIFEDHNVDEKIKMLIGHSPDVLEKIVSENEINLVFLDNGHTYKNLTSELEISHKHLKKDSYIIGHDYFNPSHDNNVNKAADDFFENHQNEYEKIGIIGREGFFILRKLTN